MLKQTAKELSALYGISGRENEVRDYIVAAIKDHCEYSIDPLGNIIAFKKGKKEAKNKVMLDAHMDEVGMMVTYICENGMLKFTKVGGINTKVIIGRTVRVGEKRLLGVVGIKPVHLTERSKERDIPDDDSLCIDIGADSKEEAEKLVKPGDEICFDSGTAEFGDGFMKGRALDDRIGCAILVEMIKAEQEYDLWFSFSVQEEVGTRGAAAAAFSIAPDYSVAVETTTASDIPGAENEKRVCLLGGGAVVSFMDRGTVYPRELFERAFELANEKGIKIQTKTVVAGGNDSAAIHKSGRGVKSLTVSVPCRYLHSPSCVINWEDAEESLRLVNALAAEFADA